MVLPLVWFAADFLNLITYVFGGHSQVLQPGVPMVHHDDGCVIRSDIAFTLMLTIITIFAGLMVPVSLRAERDKLSTAGQLRVLRRGVLLFGIVCIFHHRSAWFNIIIFALACRLNKCMCEHVGPSP